MVGKPDDDYPHQMNCKYELSLEDKMDMLFSYSHFEIGTYFDKKFDQQQMFKIELLKCENGECVHGYHEYEDSMWVILKTFNMNPNFRLL